MRQTSCYQFVNSIIWNIGDQKFRRVQLETRFYVSLDVKQTLWQIYVLENVIKNSLSFSGVMSL